MRIKIPEKLQYVLAVPIVLLAVINIMAQLSIATICKVVKTKYESITVRKN